jgi:hypothetical protein
MFRSLEYVNADIVYREVRPAGGAAACAVPLSRGASGEARTAGVAPRARSAFIALLRLGTGNVMMAP